MSWKEDREDLDGVFNSVREKYNPNWRKQHKRHLEMLHIGPETRKMGAKQIIQRAMMLDGIAPKKKKKL